MAAQPSVYNEERNLLRLRAWEQRNQDTNQAKGLNHEDVPLFGKPYKVNKGDELANRIQRMLGSYEDVNHSSPLTMEPLSIPGSLTAAQSDQCQPNQTDKSTKAPFHHQADYMSTPNHKCSSHSSQPVTASAALSPHHHGHPSTSAKISFNQGQDGLSANSAQQQKKSEVLSDVMSDDDKPQPFPHSHDDDMDTRDTSASHQESSDHPSDSVDVPALNSHLSPKESSLTQGTKTLALPSQTFPPLLPSKQPSVVMTQKPTAYVRPMDGQDQVISDSPELKPSPEPYAPLPEIINKSQPGKMKTLPPLLTKTNEALCVEDILREMTHAWPPLLTALHTPSVEASSKSPFSAKEAERVSSCPAQNSSQVGQPSSLSCSEAAHSSGETASSSDSDSSSRSDSDSESTTGEPPDPLVSSSVKPQTSAPAVSNDIWQLSKFIQFNQQNPNTVHVSESSAHTPLPSTPSSKHSSAEVVVGSCRDSKPQLSNLQTELVDDRNKPQPHSQSHENSCYQNSSHNCPSLDLKKLTCKTHTKTAKEDCVDRSQAAVSVKCEDTPVTKDKDLGLTDRPRVKTKAKHCRKSKEKDSKKESKRTTKHAALDKPKAGSEIDVKPVPQSGCTSCGKTCPDRCSCPVQSLPPSEHLSLQPPVKTTKPKEEKPSRKDSKKPHKAAAHSQPGTSKAVVKPPQPLVVKIDLSLLSRVPHMSGDLQDANSNTKKKALVVKPKGTENLVKKSSKLEVDSKPHHGKKRRLEENVNSPAHVSAKLHGEKDDRCRKKAKKNPGTSTRKETAPDSKSNKRSLSAETRDSSKEKVKRIDSDQHKKRSGKHPGKTHSEKSLKGSLNASSSQSKKESSSSRPMLKFENRQYPVKHYVKEAKRLKHKADAESDKLSKAFNYLEAAMFFVESGIAMEKDPQISMSSYTMFADTVDLLKFVLKLKSSSDSTAPPSERDFIALCLKCQSLLQMAMFRHKYKTALKYSKTLAEHFTSSQQTSVSTTKFAETPSPMADMPSPANTSCSSGPGSNLSGGGSGSGSVGSTVVPQGVEQVMFTYINITTLFMGAHEMWEQAEAMAQRGSGLLSLLDSSVGPLTLTTSMNTMVRYMRQGIHWLRLDSQKVK